MKRAFFVATLWILAVGCHHGSPPFRPYKAEYLALTPIAQRAALVYEGDLEAVLAAGAKLIGEMRTKGDKHAVLQATRLGGTHVYLVKAESETFVVGSTCSASTFDYGSSSTTNASCRNITRTVARHDYAVFRLEPKAWSALPPLLRPWPLAKPDSVPAAQCAPLPAPDPGCSYTHYRGFMKYDEDRVYLQCEGRELRDVTTTLPANTCRFGP